MDQEDDQWTPNQNMGEPGYSDVTEKVESSKPNRKGHEIGRKRPPGLNLVPSEERSQEKDDVKSPHPKLNAIRQGGNLLFSILKHNRSP